MGPRPKLVREGRGSLNPLTSTVGVVGEIGRTPIPVAESKRHPGERPLPSVREHEREEPDQKGESTAPVQDQGGTIGEARGNHEGRELEWALPRPSDPRKPPKVETGGRRQLLGTLRDRMGVLLNRSTLPLDNNCWKLTRDVKGG